MSGEDKIDNLTKLHTFLLESQLELGRKMDGSDDPKVATAISIEINEIALRVTNVGRLLFHELTKKVKAQLEKIDKEKTELKKSIDNIEELNRFLIAISKFLGLVDKVVDTFKVG